MSIDGRALANFVLDFCDARGRRITNLSLQKIVYFCHVWSLIRLGKPLVKHQFEAWQFGPVLQYLYREFREYDDQPIVGRATKIDPVTGNNGIVKYTFDKETEELLNRVVDFYSHRLCLGLIKEHKIVIPCIGGYMERPSEVILKPKKPGIRQGVGNGVPCLEDGDISSQELPTPITRVD